MVGNSVNPTATAIGVERDLFVQKTFGTATQQVNVEINPLDENLLRMVNGQSRGRVFVTWDGVDGLPGPDQVNFNGLGGIDFSIYDALEIAIAFSDLGSPINFTFWDGNDLTGNTFAEMTFIIPPNIEEDPEANPPIPASVFSKNFNTTDFTVTGPASLADILSRVGAIQMEIDATLLTGWDMNMDIVRVVGQEEVPTPPSVPEPSTMISLLALGALPFSLKLKGSKKQ